MSLSSASQETTLITTPTAVNLATKANISTLTSKPVCSVQKMLHFWTQISAARAVPQARRSTVLLINAYDMVFDY